MTEHSSIPPSASEQPRFLMGLAAIMAIGPVIFTIAILIADFVVPNHDWIADTISDLGAGKYEFIVDIGIYAYSASLIAGAVGASHAHMDDTRWSAGIYILIFTGLIVFLVGARNEYGDNDSDGMVIHSYLVYGLGAAFLLAPWLMAKGADRADGPYGRIFRGASIAWLLAAPWFFFLPTGIDGIYERGLGLITFVFTLSLAHLLWTRGRLLRDMRRG